jgi:hypothetical protein
MLIWLTRRGGCQNNFTPGSDLECHGAYNAFAAAFPAFAAEDAEVLPVSN